MGYLRRVLPIKQPRRIVRIGGGSVLERHLCRDRVMPDLPHGRTKDPGCDGLVVGEVDA